MASDPAVRAADKIARVSRSGFDLPAMWREASAVLADVVAFDWSPCWYTLDPASLLITSHFNEQMPEIPNEWLAAEYYVDDVNGLCDVARSASGLSTLHDATGGDPSTSPRWHENMKYGGDQEMISALRTSAGEVWGALGLYRAPDRPMFDEREKAFVSRVSADLAEGARRALLLGEATEPDGPDAPGLIVLDTSWKVESTTPGVDRWISDLPDGDWSRGVLPSAVLSVAGRALRSAERPEESGEVSIARVLSRSGVWIVLHGATLAGGGSPRVAVIVEPAHPAKISPLLMSVYGLTAREQDVTRLVLQGYSTAEIAETLVISLHTVQQHVKSILGKTGVRSRRDLVGKVFFTHYEPRVRENEARALGARPLRGGPVGA